MNKERNVESAATQSTLLEEKPSVVQETRVFRRRWLILAIFCSLSLSNAFQWIEYAIITNIIVKYYSVHTLAVNWTSMIYMSNYIPLIFPATWILDKYGLRIVALLGSFGNCLGALLGIAIGFVVPPMLVRNSDALSEIGADLQRLFFISAGVNSVIFLLVLAFFRDSPPVPPSPAQLAAIAATIEKNYLRSLKNLFLNRNYVLLLLTYGINVGAFYAVSTLLNQVVLDYFPSEEVNVGRIGFVIVIAGMCGSVVCGLWLDCGCCGYCRHTFKLTTLVVYIFSFLGMIAYGVTINLGLLWMVFVVAGLLGSVVNLVMVFGVIMTWGMGFLIENVSIPSCNATLAGFLFFGIMITALIKNDLRRQKAGQVQMEEMAYEMNKPVCTVVPLMLDSDDRTEEKNPSPNTKAAQREQLMHRLDDERKSDPVWTDYS